VRKYEVEMSSSCIIFPPRFVQIGPTIQRLKWGKPQTVWWFRNSQFCFLCRNRLKIRTRNKRL